MAMYDVVVIGSGLGGLATAALLASRNKKTAVIEQGASLHAALGGCGKDGYAFPSTPTQAFGLERGGDIHEMLAGLDITLNLTVPSPCYQVALPDHRITVYPERDRTLEELRREFPREIDILSKFYQNLQREAEKISRSRIASFAAKRRSAAGFIRKYGFSREVTAFFNVPSLFFFQQPLADISLASLVTLCDSAPQYLQGGIRPLAEQFYGLILQKGGEVFFNESFDGLSFGKGRVTGVKTARRVVESRSILLTTARDRHSPAFFLGIRKDVVPVGMGREVFFLPSYESPREFLSLSFGCEETGDGKTDAPSDTALLSASCRLEERLSGKEELIRQIGELIPFLDEYLIFAEECRGRGGDTGLSDDLKFRPLYSVPGVSVFARNRGECVYILDEARKTPFQVLAAAQRVSRLLT